ncbi:VOC family protein [Kutzneria sp. NPDC052558]|uniref:VOC family protein n=1 Tax=Kutzneria sp. NPDC052558 TaxID=3364121 RepID=UPI0037C64AEF
MAIELNHTIVPASDPHKSATFLAEVLGVAAPVTFGPFQVVQLDNHLSLDFMHADGDIAQLHFAFKVADDQFQPIFDRIRAAGLPYWADPQHQRANQINTNDGGRGFYFPDPDNHNLEVITRDYGSAA